MCIVKLSKCDVRFFGEFVNLIAIFDRNASINYIRTTHQPVLKQQNFNQTLIANMRNLWLMTFTYLRNVSTAFSLVFGLPYITLSSVTIVSAPIIISGHL